MPSDGLECNDELLLKENKTADIGKKKRGGRKRNKKPKDLSLYYVNINGYQSKKDSLEQITKAVKPDIVVLVETKVAKKKDFGEWETYGYEYVKRNCTRGKGGIMCALKKKTFKLLRNATSVDDDRILTCRVEYSNRCVRIIGVYGPQENDDVEDRKCFFEKLSIEIEKSFNAGEGVLIVGDLNAKLTTDTDENISHKSGNGKFLAEMVYDFGLKVVNFCKLCRGKWTWSKEVSGVQKKSCLDYVIVDKQVSELFLEMEIDEEKTLCPFHKQKDQGGSDKIVYSDHNAIMCKLGIVPSRCKEIKEPRWLITTKGLEKFREETTIFTLESGVLDQYSALEKAIFQKMSICFPKVWRKQKEEETCCSRKQLQLLKSLYDFKKKGKTQRNIIGKYITKVHLYISEKISDRKRKMIEKTVISLTVDEQFNSNQFWKLRKKLCPRATAEKTSIILENGDEVCGDSAIREAYRQEFSNRLKHNKIDERFANYEVMTNLLCDMYVSATKSILSPNFTVEEAKKVIRELSNKKAPGLDKITNEILKNAGEGLVVEMVNVINSIKNDSDSPDQWNKVVIQALFKNKGSKRELVNYRGVFLTSCISKLCEKLIMLRISDPLESVSLAQCGATKNKSPADNVFVLNACIDHAKYLNQPLYLAFYDFQQCFDKLWLEDCLIGLWKVGVRDQMLSLISSMNETAEIVVQSPCGRTEPFMANRIVKQGTVMGPQLCKVSTAEYGSETPGYQLGMVNIKPPVFVDDILNILGNIGDMSDAHRKAVLFALRKRINFGVLKCIMMIINGKKKDICPVLEIDGHILVKENKAKYVGDYFNQNGTNSDLIEDRVKRGKGKMIELLALCEESGLGRYTVRSMIELYEAVFIQILIFNCQSWSHITKQNMLALERMQLKFLKLILWLPLSTPNVFIFLEYGVLPMEHEIQRRRITYLHHILNLKNTDPVKLAYEQGLKLSHEPNWANDIKNLKMRYGISATDQEVSEMSKGKWKEIVVDQVKKVVFEELQQELKVSSKMKDVTYDMFSCQKYLLTMDAGSVRKIARLRSRTFKCKNNHRSSNSSNLLCRTGCLAIETQDHLLNCKVIHGDVPEMDSCLVREMEVDSYSGDLRELLRRVDVVENWSGE